MFEGPGKREKILTLLTMCFALFMAMLDNTVVNVALPTIRTDLGATVSDLQWIIDGYVLAFASLLLTGGILGDRYGRKRMFMSGLALFTLASLACGLSDTTSLLIASRALQGVGAAMLMPGTLSIITVTFPSHERAKAIGIWAGVSALALALGPTGGGWIVENFNWQFVFFVNVPVGIVGLFIAARVVRESVSEQTRHLDIPGLGLGTSVLLLTTWGLIESNQYGWTDVRILAALGVAAVLLACFLWWETRSRHPMMPLGFFRIPAFSAGNHVAFSISLGMFGVFFFMTLYMQEIHGYSPLEAGIRFLPMTATIIVAAPLAGRLAGRIGSRLPMTGGLTLVAGGLFLLSSLKADTSYSFIWPVFLMMGFGMGFTMTPMTAAVMNSVGAQRAGLGSAMTNTSRQIGGVLGIALLGTILSTRLKSSMTDSLATIPGLDGRVEQGIAEGAGHLQFDPHALPAELQQAVGQAFSDAFMSGFRSALLFGAAVLASAAMVAWIFIPHGAPARDHAGGGQQAGGPLGGGQEADPAPAAAR